MYNTKKLINRDVNLSKSLSWLLRHGAVKENLKIQPDGFLNVNEILSHKTFQNFTFDDIHRVVENDKKNRYSLIKCTETGLYKIKANQGHSLDQVNNSSLKKIENFEQVPIAIHGTYNKFWNSIKLEGLKKFSRNHIHFTSIENPKPNDKHSGFRENAEILIYIDTKKILEDGMEIFISENNVILCAGKNGVIKSEYFLKVIDKKTKKLLEF